MSRVRDHWSIGEVLSLLQDEFPEVTISKIRFLESQGLIDPERTTSGYRKFADVDYDRLYWILEQQRDNYLPLRVIRERLDEGQEIDPAPRRSDLRIGDQLPEDDQSEAGTDDDVDHAVDDDHAGTPPVVDNDPTPEQADASFTDALAESTGPVTSVDDGPHPVRDPDLNALTGAIAEVPDAQAGAAGAPPDSHDPGGKESGGEDDVFETIYVADPPEPAVEVFDHEAMEHAREALDAASEALETASEALDSGLEVDTRPARAASDTDDDSVEGDDPTDGSPDHYAGQPDPHGDESDDDVPPYADDVPPDSDPVIPTGSADDAAGDSDDQESSADDVTTPKPAPRLLGTRSEPARPVAKSTAEVLAPPPRPTLSGSSVALTREELAEQSGTTPGMIAELEKYGMVSPRQVGDAVLFDSTALTVARLAVQFGRYGLEPRHLKTFRLGAEREVALLTQSIGPTLKANNPETRRRSFDTLQDLAELSASLRSIIVRDLVADLEPGG